MINLVIFAIFLNKQQQLDIGNPRGKAITVKSLEIAGRHREIPIVKWKAAS